MSKPTASRQDNKSEAGKDNHKPFNWKKWGRMSSRGVKNSSGRVIAMIKVGIALPMEGKTC